MKQFKFILLFFFIGFVSPDFCFSRNVIEAKDMYELMEKVEKDIGWLSSNSPFAVSVQHKRKRYVSKRSCRKIYSSDTIYALLYSFFSEGSEGFYECVYGGDENYVYGDFQFYGVVRKYQKDSDLECKKLISRMILIDSLTEKEKRPVIDEKRFDTTIFLTIERLSGNLFQYKKKVFIEDAFTDDLFLIESDSETQPDNSDDNHSQRKNLDGIL